MVLEAQTLNIWPLREVIFVLFYPHPGAGKTTISKMLIKKDKSISLSISRTTRPKKRRENKNDYIFMSDKEFSNLS